MIFMLISTPVFLSSHQKVLNLILQLPYDYSFLFFGIPDEAIIRANNYNRYSTSKNRSNGI